MYPHLTSDRQSNKCLSSLTDKAQGTEVIQCEQMLGPADNVFCNEYEASSYGMANRGTSLLTTPVKTTCVNANKTETPCYYGSFEANNKELGLAEQNPANWVFNFESNAFNGCAGYWPNTCDNTVSSWVPAAPERCNYKWDYPRLNVLQQTVFINPSVQDTNHTARNDYSDAGRRNHTAIMDSGRIGVMKAHSRLPRGNESQRTGDQQFNSLIPTQNSAPRARRRRMCYTTEQVQMLEKAFAGSQTPDDGLRTLLSDKLNVDMKRIQIWFKNRRAKERRLRKFADTVLSNDNNCTDCLN